MAAVTPTATPFDYVEGEKKNDAVYTVFPDNEVGRMVLVDYSGARAKTDPTEIKLVRKLDKWIMVTPVFLSGLSTSLTPLSPRSGECTG